MSRVLGVVALLLLATAAAEHTQTDSDHEASFDHVTGNEWWVEVDVDHDGDLHGVDARDDDGAWVPLEKKSWGVWAGSFHIEPGHDVQFRAHQGDFGRIESCWFSHPEGVEQCQSDWHVSGIDKASDREYLHDTTIADVDGDGVQELLVAATDGIRIYAFDDGWSLQETVAGDELFGEVETGDLDADGRLDIVAENIDTDIQFTRLEYDGTWQRMDYLGPARGGSAFTVGDPDGDGRDAVYISDYGPEVPVYEVRLVENAWQEEQIATVAEGVDVLHVGDGDGDGDDELYAGGGYKGDDSLLQIEYDTGSWTKVQIGSEHGSNSVFDIGTGDADGDGRSELYHTSEDPDFDSDGSEFSLWKNTFSDAWSQESIATFLAPDYPRTSLVADGDNDGTDEIYVAVTGSHDLRIIQVEKTATGWSQDRVVVANGGGEPRLAAGDPDQDGLTELASIEKRGAGFVHVFSEHAPGSGDTTTSPFTFDHTGSNEWWVQVRVTGQEPGRVQAMDTDGPWKELEKKDWGDWAASFRIESGHDVRFRALDGGTWHESCWFTHPDGVSPGGDGACTGPESGSGGDGGTGGDGGSSGFDASFSTPGGNAWWVEAYVDANEDLAGVDARDDGGAWVALEKKSWGAWAKSFHVADGSLMDFRATSTDGDVDISGQYRWPSGDQVTSEPDDDDGGDDTGGEDPMDPAGTLDALIAPKAGNEWWVETYAFANNTVAEVDARVETGSWKALEKRSWGAWAASFHVPSGSSIEFRARDASQETVSVPYTWPDAVPVAQQGEAWPHEGSYARYRFSESNPGGVREANATHVFHEDRWHLFCAGKDSFSDGDTLFTSYSMAAPPQGPTDVAVGQRVTVQSSGCGIEDDEVVVREQQTEPVHVEGDPKTVPTWYGQLDEDRQEYIAEWERSTGLVVAWNFSGTESDDGGMHDTDAPIS